MPTNKKYPSNTRKANIVGDAKSEILIQEIVHSGERYTEVLPYTTAYYVQGWCQHNTV